MVVALRYIFATLWYCVCILSCIDTHHFVYTSLSQSLYPSIIGLVMMLLYMTACAIKRKLPSFSAAQILAMALAAYILLHGVFVKEPELYKQGYTVATLLLMIVLAGIVGDGVMGKSHIENAIILVLTINIAYLILQFLGLMDSGNSFFRLAGANENPNTAAIALTVGIPFIIRRMSQKKHVYLMSTLLLLVVVFLLTLKCRTAYMGVVCIITCYLVKSHKIRRFVQNKFCKKSGVIWLTVTGFLVIALAAISYSWKKDSADGRVFIWQRDCEMIADSPLGYGYGKYEVEYNLYQSRYFASHKDEYANSILTTASDSAYNDILEHGVQGGIIGGMLYLSMLLFPVYQAYRAKKWYCFSVLLSVVVMTTSNGICYCVSPWIMTIATMALVATPTGKSSRMPIKALCSSLLLLMSVSLLYRDIQLAKGQTFLKTYKTESNHNIVEITKLYPAIGTSEAYWRFRAECNEQNGDYKAADTCYEQARKYTSAPLLLFNSAMCKENIGDTLSALEIMKTAVYMLPRNFSLKYHLMMMYRRMGDNHHARLVAQEIVSTPEKIHNESVHFIKEEAERILNE